jgi:hypothetical protein
MHLIFTYCLCFSLFITPALNARFAEEQETDYTVEKNEETITVKKDGSYESITETVTLLKTEQARDERSKMVLTYRDGTEKIEIISAKTIIDGKEYIVDKKHIEDKQLASSSNGFEDRRQIIIAFPKAEVGARLCIKTKFTSNLIITKNHFYILINLLGNGWLVEDKTTIRSEIPLYLKMNDPRQTFDIKTNAADETKPFTEATITLKKPATELVVNDVFGSLPPKKSTWVSVSSLENWDDMAKDLFPKYDEILAQKLPALYEEIIEQAKCEKTEAEQINKIMSLLAEKVQYLGSWMTFGGMFIPRDLQEVETTRFADCKDFSTGTVAMLRAVGLQAEVVFVQRGEWVVDYTNDTLPNFLFNHAMVKAVGKDGTIYWLDPTNFTSSTFVYPDIANRHTLVPNKENRCKAILEKIPEVESFEQKKTDILTLTEDDRLQHDVIIDLSETSRTCQMLTGIHLRMPSSIVEDEIFGMIAHQTIKAENRLKKGIPTLKERTIKPIKLDLSFISDDLRKSNIGFAYIIPAYIGLISMIDMVKENDILDWNIDLTGEYKTQYIIKNKCVKNLDRIKRKVETPWFTVERDADYAGSDTIITQTIKVLKRYVPSTEFGSETFKKAQKEIIKNFKNYVINFEDN